MHALLWVLCDEACFIALERSCCKACCFATSCFAVAVPCSSVCGQLPRWCVGCQVCEWQAAGCCAQHSIVVLMRTVPCRCAVLDVPGCGSVWLRFSSDVPGCSRPRTQQQHTAATVSSRYWLQSVLVLVLLFYYALADCCTPSSCFGVAKGWWGSSFIILVQLVLRGVWEVAALANTLCCSCNASVHCLRPILCHAVLTTHVQQHCAQGLVLRQCANTLHFALQRAGGLAFVCVWRLRWR
jgi:hypothetical protein